MSFAPCPTETPPSLNPPTSIVVVSILKVRPNTDLEGEDDFIPFYDDRADIYGYVTIDGEKFDLPKINEDDFPHWDQNGVFRKKVDKQQIPIKIDIWESDEFDDNQVNICPLPDKASLDLVFDACSLLVSGDITESTKRTIMVPGGSGNNDATIWFTIKLEDGRPLSNDDLALIEVDLVQVRHNTERLVARKPTVVMVRIANNFSLDITTDLELGIVGGGVNIQDTFTIDMKAGEVKKIYLYQDTPIRFSPSDSPYKVVVSASLKYPGSDELPLDDCRRKNDSFSDQSLWKVVTTPENFQFLWMKVGTLLDIGNYTPNEQFTEIKELGYAYIKAVFPLATPAIAESPFPMSPPASAGIDYMVTALSTIGIPADALEPFVLVFELDSVAVLTGYDRLMGVLPSHDWFKRFSYWEDIFGLSLGEYKPHAVIFLPQTKSDDGLDSGPQMTLPGHELGHTFGLSTDSRLKKSWVCNVPWPVVGSLPCGAVGGFDEYKHDDPSLQDGNPASGYWVSQGGEPAAILSLVNKEQCDFHCLMGNSPRNAHLNWNTSGRWIDAADYDHLIDQLELVKDPEIIYVSGMIAWHDQMYLGPVYHLPQGTPDREDSFGLYAVRFVDDQGKTLAEYGIPINWNTPEFDRPMPITFFGLKFPYPQGTKRIIFLNRGTNKILAEQKVSNHLPTVRIVSPEPGRTIEAGSPIEVAWEAADEDNDSLTFTVLLSPNRESWWPVVTGLSEPRFNLATEVLEPGDYHMKLLAHDGVHIGESQLLPIHIIR